MRSALHCTALHCTVHLAACYKHACRYFWNPYGHILSTAYSTYLFTPHLPPIADIAHHPADADYWDMSEDDGADDDGYDEEREEKAALQQGEW